MRKKALILGILGQDGYCLSELLSKKGYEIYGVAKKTTSDERIEKFPWGAGIFAENVDNPYKLKKIIKQIHPDEIYNFAGVSNVFNAWENLDATFELNARLPQNILEIIIHFDKNIKLFQASSCLTFGRDESGKQNEQTAANPIHPYGITKLYADNMVKEFRHAHDVFAVSGIFFNHESERRGDNFFSKKITCAAARIKNGSPEKINVGALSALRDYGYAPDFMEAVWGMMQNEKPTDYVIGTGQLISMEEFTKKCFEYVGLYYKDHINMSDALVRKTDTNVLCADITKIKTELGWQPTHTVEQMIKKMINYELEKQNN